MGIQAQTEADRHTAQKSTRPRPIKGKAVSRFDGLKSCILAKSPVIPGNWLCFLRAVSVGNRPRTRASMPKDLWKALSGGGNKDQMPIENKG